MFCVRKQYIYNIKKKIFNSENHFWTVKAFCFSLCAWTIFVNIPVVYPLSVADFVIVILLQKLWFDHPPINFLQRLKLYITKWSIFCNLHKKKHQNRFVYHPLLFILPYICLHTTKRWKKWPEKLKIIIWAPTRKFGVQIDTNKFWEVKINVWNQRNVQKITGNSPWIIKKYRKIPKNTAT